MFFHSTALEKVSSKIYRSKPVQTSSYQNNMLISKANTSSMESLKSYYQAHCK